MPVNFLGQGCLTIPCLWKSFSAKFPELHQALLLHIDRHYSPFSPCRKHEFNMYAVLKTIIGWSITPKSPPNRLFLP